MYFAGALNLGALSITSRTSSGDFLYRSPSIFPGMPHERKYSKSGRRPSANPVYRLPPGQPISSPRNALASPRGSESGLRGDSKDKLHRNSEFTGPRLNSASDMGSLCQLEPPPGRLFARFPSPGLAQRPFCCNPALLAGILAHFGTPRERIKGHGSRKIKPFDLTVRQGTGDRRGSRRQAEAFQYLMNCFGWMDGA